MPAPKEDAGKRSSAAQRKVPLAQRRMARQLIMQALYQWLMSGSEEREIRQQFKEANEGKIDWEYFDAVFPQVIAADEELLGFLHPHLDREIKALDPVEKALLLLGSFELARRIDVPYRVVINECVELAKQYGATDSHKYINGVLDKLAPTLRAVEYGR